MPKQKLSPKAAAAKKARDLKTALTPRRTKMKAENQRKRRAAKKRGTNIDGKDYDHNRSSFVSVKTNRSATKTTNNTMKKKPTLLEKTKAKIKAKTSPKKKSTAKPSAAMKAKIKAKTKTTRTSPLKKTCHSSDAACMKRQREARKKSSTANHAKRAASYSKTGDKKAFYKDSTPTKFAKGSLRGVGTPIRRKKK